MTPEKYPLISVRIPAYNHEKYIETALDSVRTQSYPNKEIVIIDDGSTDGTPDVITRWIEEHSEEIPVKFRSRPNKGVSRTINELIEMAEGEFLVGLASDDFLLENSLMARFEYLASRPEKLAVFADSMVVDGEGNVLYSSGLADLHSANKNLYCTDRGLKKEIIQNWAVPGSTIMMRKELHSRFRYNENLRIEDRDFYLKMVSENILGFTDKVVTAYRLHGRNTILAPGSRLVGSVDKFRALAGNAGRFSWSDRVLFIRPLLMSAAGVAVYSLIDRRRPR